MNHMDAERQEIFSSEWNILNTAKVDLSAAHDAETQHALYGRLIQDYEKLLRLTIKLSRISDIQGRTLKEQELKIQNANESLRHMEDLRRKLVHDISHELGTPMTTVQGYVKALLDGVVQPDERYLGIIYSRLLLISRLVSDLFQLSSLQAEQIPFDLKEIALDDLLCNIPDEFAIDASAKGIRLELEHGERFSPACQELADALVIVRADPIRIDQVFSNLITNAIKYTPDQGRVTVQAQVISESELAIIADSGKTVKPHARNERKSRHHLLVRISDTGTGIEDLEQLYLFDRFYRAAETRKQDVSGVGLGLAISKEIIMRHGGIIGVSSRKGQGSTFYFSLPAEVLLDEQTDAPADEHTTLFQRGTSR
jgi:signal transduction histidine kinase